MEDPWGSIGLITCAQERVRAPPLNDKRNGPGTHCDAAHVQWGVPKLGGRCWEGRCWEGRCWEGRHWESGAGRVGAGSPGITTPG